MTLAQGGDGVRAVQRHLMERYRDALLAYASVLPARSVAEPADLVAGFFARRVGSDGFIDAWRASGLPMHRYLMNGLSLDARTLLRSERREAVRRKRYAMLEAVEAHTRARRDADAEVRFERVWARAMVGEACERLRVECERANDAASWESFEAHVMRGASYAAIARARGDHASNAEERLAVAVRRLLRRMRATLRELLQEEGVAEDELDRELRLVSARLRG